MNQPMSWRGTVLAAVAALTWGALSSPLPAGEGRGAPWSVSVSGGWLDAEGDELVEDAPVLSVRLGHDMSDGWTLEGVLDILPEMNENLRTHDRLLGQPSGLERGAGPGIRETACMRVGLDAIRFLSGEGRWRHYVGVGVGAVWYEEDFGQHTEAALRLRAGIERDLNRTWALRGDWCGMMVGGVETELNSMAGVGLVCRFGPEGRRSAAMVLPEPLDTDFDGLTDEQETEIHKTDPLKRDTDGGGVADGHEVIEDATDPLAGSDDLRMFELHMNFDPKSAVIRSEYFSELDAIGRIVKSAPGATARVEGHVDRLAGASARKAKRLTQHRAESIRDYFRKNLGIPSRRLTAVGYGFDRPAAANDPETGNPKNVRIEIYIRGSVER